MSDAPGKDGRAVDARFVENPLPVAAAIGTALALMHSQAAPAGLEARTPVEIDQAREIVSSGGDLPYPYSRSSREALLAALDSRPERSSDVYTHGAPVVRAALIDGPVVTFESMDVEGVDPPERDLAIAIRSVAETFTGEVAGTLLDSYVTAGGQTPYGPAIDWYGMLAAFR